MRTSRTGAIQPFFGRFSVVRMVFHSGSSSMEIPITRPKYSPNTTAFQLAVCQMPISRNTSSVAIALGTIRPVFFPKALEAAFPRAIPARQVVSGYSR